MNLYLLFQEGFFVKFESKNLSEKFLAEAEFCKIDPKCPGAKVAHSALTCL
jgi:hypothetical protein